MSQFDAIIPSLIQFPEALPVSAKRTDIAQALKEEQVLIVCGETGSGKTTQLPKICLSIGRGRAAGGRGMIAHTQPRRLAAISTAKRIAQELDSSLGQHVGYKIRFADKTSEHISIKLMTDGVLLAETQSDPLLSAYDTIIIDEAHERSLNIDFLLGYLKQLLPKRPDLKLIITSATIDAQRFANHFSASDHPVPIIEVSGRLYPVEIRYRPMDKTEEKDNDQTPLLKKKLDREPQRDLMEAIVDGVDELSLLGEGDILVFLPGEREIHQAAQILRQHLAQHVQILPLFARLSMQEQDKVFKTSNARRIVLATNVAETSLTVPGIRFVIDTGIARVKRYSYRQKVEQLHIEAISQASANQRAGRCGRVMDGVCLRLYSELDFQSRPAFTEPEVLRSSLASVILRMKSLNLSDIRDFPFVDKPSHRAIADGDALLKELGAINEAGSLSPLGRQLAKLPVDPKIARMILAARDYHCLNEILIIASALSIQDPKERPLELQALADQAHAQFADTRSEFLSWLKWWKWFDEALQKEYSQRQLRRLCQAHFVSYSRMREWQEVHHQLSEMIQSWSINQTPATYEQIHCALLSGLLGNIGLKTNESVLYLGARGIKFYIWPGSSLFKKAGKWIVASELVETTRLYARGIAKIEPEWIEKVAPHLLKTQISDPHWEKKAGRVVAYQQATLYGLPIYQRRQVAYANFDQKHAREIFIRSALVEQDWETRLPFVVKNRQLLKDIAQLEHRSRRQDILVDDELIFAFYDRYLPETIADARSCEAWYKQQQKQGEKGRKAIEALFLKRNDLMRHEAAGITSELYPNTLLIANVPMSLSYHFDPQSSDDGVTLRIPLYALNLVSVQTEWLVPGLLKAKIQALIKSLPASVRRHCVPIEAYALACQERLKSIDQHKEALLPALIADLEQNAGVKVHQDQFKLENLPAHLLMNFHVVDEHNRIIAAGRHLSALKQSLGAQAQHRFQKIAHLSTQSKSDEVTQLSEQTSSLPLKQTFTQWSFGDLPETVQVKHHQQSFPAFPALVDEKMQCTIELFDDPEEAKMAHQKGLCRLFALQMRDVIRFNRKNLPHLQESSLYFMPLGTQEELFSQIIDASLRQAFIYDPLPRTEESFKTRLSEGKQRFNLLAQEIAQLVWQILIEYTQINKKRAELKAYAHANQDIEMQLKDLLVKRFIADTPFDHLKHFPRYLKGILMRMDKLKEHFARDQQMTRELQPLLQQYQRARASAKGQLDVEWVRFRWLLEELRISLFAQSLKTPVPVSIKRLTKICETLQR